MMGSVSAGRCRLLAWILGWAVASPAAVTLSPWQENPDTGANAPGPLHRQRYATFALGLVTYEIHYNAWRKADDPSFCKVGEGPVGMPRPTSEGWYHGGFINVSLDGRRLDTGPLSSFELVEHGARSMVDLVWHDPRADLRYRIAGQDGDDHLTMEVTLEPHAAVTSWQVELVAYPSYFTSWNHRVGARRIWTPGGTILEGQKALRTPGDGRAALLYDEVFDPAKGEGHGPCAVAFGEPAFGEPAVDAAGVEQIEYQATNYPCYARVRLKPDSRTLRLALWKFPDQANGPVLAAFPARAEAVLAQLRAADFTPAALRSFDSAEMQHVLDEARRRPAIVQKLGPRLDRLAAWLAACGEPKAGGARDIRATETFLAGLAEEEDLLWDIRLAELLDF
jgi:hypothetical protein